MTDLHVDDSGPRRRAIVGLVLAVVVAVVVMGQIRSDPAATTTTVAPVPIPPPPPSTSISTTVAESGATTIADPGATTVASETAIPIAVDPSGNPGGSGTPESFTLRVDVAANCLYLESTDGARVKPVWRLGTTSRRNPVQVVVAGEAVATEDETVELSGSYGAEITAEDPLACGATETWVVSS